jgi:hypothetical protein
MLEEIVAMMHRDDPNSLVFETPFSLPTYNFSTSFFCLLNIDAYCCGSQEYAIDETTSY